MHNPQKEQGRTASSTMTTSDETSEQNQRASIAAPLAPSPTVNILEISVSTDSQKLSTLRAPTALNTPGNDITSPMSMATTVSKMSISPTTLNKITAVKRMSAHDNQCGYLHRFTNIDHPGSYCSRDNHIWDSGRGNYSCTPNPNNSPHNGHAVQNTSQHHHADTLPCSGFSPRHWPCNSPVT